MCSFEIGKLVITNGINNFIEQKPKYREEIIQCLSKYIGCDWGEVCQEDKAANDSAIINNNDRVLARYSTSYGPIYIITEWDRSYTTILFVGEY